MQRKQPFTYEEFKAIYSKVPRLCVDIVIKTEEGTLLTLREKDGWEGQWHLPGGTVFYQEGLENAIKRIAMEELMMDVAPEKLLGYIDYQSEVKMRGFGNSIAMVFLCKINKIIENHGEVLEKAEYFQTLPENTILEQKQFLEKNL